VERDDLHPSCPRQRIVIVGATSASAEHCVRHWVQAGPLEPVLVALFDHGLPPDQKACQPDLRQCAQALQVNALPVLFAKAFARHMAMQGLAILPD